MLTKSLLPLPDKWHGLADVERRYRQRYLDMIVTDETRATFRARSTIVSTIRRFLEDRAFLEVGCAEGCWWGWWGEGLEGVGWVVLAAGWHCSWL